MRHLSVIIMLLVSGCHGYWDGDPELYGAFVEVDAGAAWPNGDIVDINDPQFRARLIRVMTMAHDFWDGRDDMWGGWRIRIKNGNVWCGGSGGYGGCADRANHTITITTLNSYCIEYSALLHEAGHIANFPSMDTDHRSDKWYAWNEYIAMWDSISVLIPPDDSCRTMMTWLPGTFPTSWGRQY